MQNIPLEIALQAVGANGAVPVDLNSLLDGHHYVLVPVMTTVIVIILVGSVIGGVIITRLILREALRNRESRQEEEEESRPRKPTALQPPSYRQPVPPPYAAAGKGQSGYCRILVRSITITGNGLTGKRRVNSRAFVRHASQTSSSNARRVPDGKGPGNRQ
jgi:hypothetical protein